MNSPHACNAPGEHRSGACAWCDAAAVRRARRRAKVAAKLARKAADVRVECHGSIWLLQPLTHAGQTWLDVSIPEDAMMLGDAIAVEHRFVGPIVDGMRHDGLKVTA
jgi:hypothetical protein